MSNKYKNIPPLRAIKAFEASARLLSFTQAAQELHVTQAAISHQIKNLEVLTGVQLFQRFNRSLKLTFEGRLYLISVRNALESIEKATRQLKNKDASGTLNISVLPSFATKWLSKRIWRFQQQHKELDVRISAFEWLTDFKKDDCDIAIRYTADPNYPGLKSELLLEEEVFPVCSKQVYESYQGKLTPKSLLNANLCHEDFTTEDWHDWFDAVQIQAKPKLRGTRFSHMVTMLEAVENHQGFALGRTPLVQDDINRGLLVEPFKQRIKGEMSYYLVYPRSTESDQKLQIIRQWLFAEAEQFKNSHQSQSSSSANK
ncbi:transcriptional regulator GcvA [Marinicella litoralis]|uniref:LysR family glycine cleavage system transcriptional activator n=1 Tax=Marinicella litoralis TaxID=644220 RepID=A0A4R6Y135_9GAMM|nr:transcriptional regulator GcvA [Marinicella litoralis]TDR22658.1 LysR family glycine cleavage system transcriptional activator [Marinicella litoralis]